MADDRVRQKTFSTREPLRAFALASLLERLRIAVDGKYESDFGNTHGAAANGATGFTSMRLRAADGR